MPDILRWQFGGISSVHCDIDLAPFVAKSFVKHFKDGLRYIEGISSIIEEEGIKLGNVELASMHPRAYEYAVDMLEKEGRQAAQGLWHNLNTLKVRGLR